MNRDKKQSMYRIVKYVETSYCLWCFLFLPEQVRTRCRDIRCPVNKLWLEAFCKVRLMVYPQNQSPRNANRSKSKTVLILNTNDVLILIFNFLFYSSIKSKSSRHSKPEENPQGSKSQAETLSKCLWWISYFAWKYSQDINLMCKNAKIEMKGL